MFVSTGLFKHFTVPTSQNGPFTYISCWTAELNIQTLKTKDQSR